MNTEAVIMMVVAMLIIWGGLGLAVQNLRRSNPPSPDEVNRDL